MRIAIGSDHAGFDLKEEAKAFLLAGPAMTPTRRTRVWSMTT
jgi:ribose 5-phosphate isomerase RpiB